MSASVTCRFITKASPAAAREIITIYRAQGWWGRGAAPAALNRLIRGSHCFVTAERAGRVIGMARAISDGVGDAYIQDVAVLGTERGSGVGKKLVSELKRRLKKDGITWIGLIAQNNSKDFYRKIGFEVLRRAHPMLLKGTHV